jgi:Uma2 family endonuclease
VSLLIQPEYGGQARISQDDIIEGAPELIAEVASSSVSIELHTKLRVYRRSGVRGYIVWRTLDKVIDWFVLREGAYNRLSPNVSGLLQSEVFPGLWLNPAALIHDDRATLQAAARSGLDSPEHAAFVARLEASRRETSKA